MLDNLKTVAKSYFRSSENDEIAFFYMDAASSIEGFSKLGINRVPVISYSPPGVPFAYSDDQLYQIISEDRLGVPAMADWVSEKTGKKVKLIFIFLFFIF